MKQSIILLLTLSSILSFTSCNKRNDLEPEIKFKTTEGTIVVRLYAETPQHRDNFVKLVESGYYNGMLFHRVIKDFMIQSGDPASKKAQKKQFLGSGDVNYSIPAEIVYPKYYHKKGALAAARQGDDTNPERASSGGQFYFVKGHKFNDKQLDSLENVRKIKVEKYLTDKYIKLKLGKSEIQKKGNSAKIKLITDSIALQVKNEIASKPELYKFNAEQRETYKTIGGTPHLDGEYTVFGEVIEGVDMVSNISKAKTDKNDRPLQNIRIIEATRIR